jgi:hypothetical protein
MAEQYFANKDKDMMAPKTKMAAKGPMKKVFVLPRKGQKAFEDVERMGRKVKRVIEVPMKAKQVLKTVQARQFTKAEKAMMTKAAKKLEGVIKKRAERAEARATKPLTLEEQNIKKQLEEKLQKGIEAAKSPEQKKMEKEMLLALEAPAKMEMMAIEAPKGKAGRPKGVGKPIQIGDYLNTLTIPEVEKWAKDLGLSKPKKQSTENKEQFTIRMMKAYEEEQAKPEPVKITKFLKKMPALQEKQEPLVSEEESEDEPIANVAAEVVADITGAPEIKEQASLKLQSAFRGMLARRKFKEMKDQEAQGQQVLKFPYINYILSKSSDFTKNELEKMKVAQLENIIQDLPETPVAGKGLVGGGVVDFVKGLASKAIDHIKKDPIGAIKQAVEIGKKAYEHGSKAKEMYDKFFKGKAKGGMLSGFTEPEKRHMVHKIYHLNLFNKMMEQVS